jgi:histidyl-tRNA synthetase
MGERATESLGPEAYLVCFDDSRRAEMFELAQTLRRELLLEVELDLAARSAKGQLKQASRSDAECAVLIGLEELAPDVARVRDLESGEEHDVPIAELVTWFAEAEGEED